MEELLKIQQELKAPKEQFNKFGGYKYRSCEDILSAVKPYLEKYKVVLVMKDDIVEFEANIDFVSDTSKDGKTYHTEYHWPRFYVMTTATLYSMDGKVIMSSSAYAREEQDKAGMDGAQITGSASSYARKYALNGLFAIDDGVDPDSTNKWDEAPAKDSKPAEKPWFNKEQLDNLTKKAGDYESADAALAEVLKYYRISKDMEANVRKLYDSLDSINS